MENANLPGRYWGKDNPHYPSELGWDPLVQHYLDVAAVGGEYIRRTPSQRRLFVEATQPFSPQGNGS